MTIDMNQFFQVFFDEAEELLAEMEKLLLAVDISSPDNEQLHAIFRTAHSIKGGASTFGLTDLSDVTHLLESLLDKIRNGGIALTRQQVDVFLAAKDVLKMQLDGHQYGNKVDHDAVSEIKGLLGALMPPGIALPMQSAVSNTSSAVSDAGKDATVRISFPKLPEDDFSALVAELGLLGEIVQALSESEHHVVHLRTSRDREEILDICTFILNAETIEIAQISGPILGSAPEATDRRVEEAQGYGFFEPFVPIGATQSLQVPDGCHATPASHCIDDVHELQDEASGPDSGSLILPSAAKSAVAKKESDKNAQGHESSSIRVGVEKVDQLINLVGELVITQAMIEQRTSSLDPLLHEKLLSSVNQLTRNTRALQESVMSIRMMPMDYAFSRFPRLVRDLANKLGKQVDFVTHGAATELDKGLIERIVDPLTHLVRNSVDHGIEMPDIRVASNKTPTGRLSLSAAHQGGNIVIEVSDDGAGLNRERILAKAREKGLPVQENMADADVWQLIFAPGFSTAEQVTDVSGRGVGMDVVRRNIKSMGGSINIQSSKGYGTTISISLPLTLAILDGMSVRVGDDVYILPLGYVVESLQPTACDIKQISGQGSVVKVRGEYLPVMQLHQFFGAAQSGTDVEKGILVILESEGRQLALAVDELVGQQHVVVKNLESNYRRVAGISGATILGDGGVSLIIDVSALLRFSNEVQRSKPTLQ